MKRKLSPQLCSTSEDEMVRIDGEGFQPNTSEQILEQDRFLPIANISRIMKRVIPAEGKLSKEAKECVQECISEFLLFITSEASEKCQNERRKTITGEDLITAFRTLGFDDYIAPLEEFLTKYRDANKLHNTVKVEPLQNVGTSSNSGVDVQFIESIVGTSNNSHPQASSSAEYRLDDIGVLQKHQQQQPAASAASRDASQVQYAPINTPTTLQQMQMFYDATNKQYYITVQGTDGTHSLLPVNLTPANSAVSDNGEQLIFADDHHSEVDAGQVMAESSSNNSLHQQEQTVRDYLQKQQNFHASNDHQIKSSRIGHRNQRQ